MVRVKTETATKSQRRKTPPGLWIGLLLAPEPAPDRGLRWILVLLAASFTAIISYCQIRSLDLWWHLKTGEWIWQHQAIPRTDPFSFSAAGLPWVSHEWLFGLLAFITHRLGGIDALVIVKCLLIATLFLLCAWTARLRGASAGLTFLLLCAAYPIVRLRLLERPELLSVPLAIGFLLVFEWSRKTEKALLAWPLLQWLWVNVHGGTALLGLALAGILTIDRALGARFQGSVNNPYAPVLRSHHGDLGALAAVTVVSMFNPHGWRVLFYGLVRAESPLENKEFQSLRQIVEHGVDFSLVLFLCFVGTLLLCLILKRRHAPLRDWLLFPFLLLLTIQYFRFRILFVFLLLPALACHLTCLWPLKRLRLWIPGCLGLLLIAYSAMLERETYFYRFGTGIHSGVLPREAAEFVREAGLTGNMFNSYGIGGYLTWALGAQRPVFIDGREDVYVGPGILSEYVHCFDSRENWLRLSGKYRFEYAIVKYPENPPSVPQRSLDVLAFARETWALIYFDDLVAVYGRRGGRNDAAIAAYEIRRVQPFQISSYLDSIVRDASASAEFRSEMRLNRERHPSSFRNPFTMGLYALKQGSDHLREALGEFEQTVALNSDFAPGLINLGSIYQAIGRISEARDAYRRALTLEPNNPFVRQQLQRLR